MKRIIRLTESDLVNLVKKVISEQEVTQSGKDIIINADNMISAGFAERLPSSDLKIKSNYFTLLGNVNPQGNRTTGYYKLQSNTDSTIIDQEAKGGGSSKWRFPYKGSWTKGSIIYVYDDKALDVKKGMKQLGQ